MQTKTLLTALALTLAPAIAQAACIGSQHEQTASCKAGTTWDAGSSSCVANPVG